MAVATTPPMVIEMPVAVLAPIHRQRIAAVLDPEITMENGGIELAPTPGWPNAVGETALLTMVTAAQDGETRVTKTRRPRSAKSLRICRVILSPLMFTSPSSRGTQHQLPPAD